MNKLVLRGIEAELETLHSQNDAVLDELTAIKQQMVDLQLQNAMLLELVRTLVNRPVQQQYVFPNTLPANPIRVPSILNPGWVPPPQIWSGGDGIKVT